MTPDDLDGKTDAELNELFAVEVAETLEPIEPRMGEARAYADTRTGAYRNCEWRDHFTDFCVDLASVVPWLEKRRTDHGDNVGLGLGKFSAGLGWVVHIIDNSTNTKVEAVAYPLSRAIVIALLRIPHTP